MAACRLRNRPAVASPSLAKLKSAADTGAATVGCGGTRVACENAADTAAATVGENAADTAAATEEARFASAVLFTVRHRWVVQPINFRGHLRAPRPIHLTRSTDD